MSRRTRPVRSQDARQPAVRQSGGMILAELLLASTVGFVVLLAVSQVDVTRVLLTDQLGRSASSQSEAAMALAHMSRALQQADRVNLVAANNLRLRIPQNPANLDANAGYRWVQYRFNAASGEIRYFELAPGCTLRATFRDLSGLNVQYGDEAAIAPPGGEPLAGADNNVLLLEVSWTDPRTGVVSRYNGEVTIRGGAYTNLMTGLAPGGVGNPPAAPGCV